MFTLPSLKNTLIRILVYGVFSIAIVITLFRLSLVLLIEQPALIEKWLSQKFNAPVEIQHISTDWKGSDLMITFKDIQIQTKETKPIGSLKEMGLILDTVQTIRHLEWQVKALWANQLEWTLRETSTPNSPGEWLSSLRWLYHQPYWSFKDILIHWHPTNQPEVTVTILKMGRTIQAAQNLLSGSIQYQVKNLPQPSSLQFSARFEGDLEEPEALRGEFFVQGDQLALPPLSQVLKFPFTIQDGKLDVKLWGTFQEGVQITSAFNFNHLLLGTTSKEEITIPSGEFKLLFQKENGKNWILKGRQKNLIVNNKSWPESVFQAQKTPRDHQPLFSFITNYLDIGALSMLLQLVPEERLTPPLLDLIQKGKPSGILQDVHLAFSDCHTPEMIRGKFQNLELSAFKNWPEFNGLTGEIWHEHETGILTVQNRDFQIYFPQLFRNVLSFAQLDSIISWHKNEKTWFVQAPRMAVKNKDLELTTRFQFVLADQKPPELNLIASFSNAKGEAHSRYLPTKIMDEELVNWLDRSIIKANVPQGALVFRGPLPAFPFTDHSGVFEVSSQIADLNLNYDPSWPVIQKGKGQLHFTDKSMHVDLSHGTIANTSVQKVVAVIPNFLIESPQLNIESLVMGDSKHALSFLRQYLLPKRLDKLMLKGPFQLSLNLSIPLEEENQAVQVKGMAHLVNNQIMFSEVPFSLDHLNGKIHFTADDIHSEPLTAQLFEEPVSLELKTLKEPKNTLEAIINGTLDGQSLYSHTPQNSSLKSLFQKMEGKTAYRAWFQFKKGGTTHPSPKETTARFSFQSDLNGIAIHLPSPLPKSKEEAGTFQVEGKFFENEQGKIVIKAKANEQAPPISLSLDTTPTKDAHIILVQGQIPPITIEDWSPLFATDKGVMPEKADIESSYPDIRLRGGANRVEITDLLFENVTVANRHFPSLHLRAQPFPSQWVLSMKGADLIGSIRIPVRSSKEPPPVKPIEFNFEYLNLPPKDKKEGKPSVLTITAFKPTDVPRVNGNIQKLMYEGKELGSVKLTTQPNPQGVLFQTVLQNKDISSTEVDCFWTEQKGQSTTQLKGTFHSKNISKDLAIWKLDAGIKDSSADIGFTLRWNGDPTAFDLEKVRGEITLKLKDGQLVDVSPGPSRILGLLSVQALKRRLTLDFSDLFNKGLSFDKVTGTFLIKKGNAYTCDTVLVGPSANITLQGRTGLVARDYHQVAYVAIDLTGSLPFVVAVFNPIAGAATWIGNKLLEPQINKLTRIQYIIKGPWDNPTFTMTKTPPLIFKPWEIIPELLPPLQKKEKRDQKFASWCIPEEE